MCGYVVESWRWILFEQQARESEQVSLVVCYTSQFVDEVRDGQVLYLLIIENEEEKRVFFLVFFCVAARTEPKEL